MSKLELIKHKSSHHQNKRIYCNAKCLATRNARVKKCSRFFYTERELEKHIEDVEAITSTYTCTVCGRKTANKERLRTHTCFLNRKVANFCMDKETHHINKI